MDVHKAQHMRSIATLLLCLGLVTMIQLTRAERLLRAVEEQSDQEAAEAEGVIIKHFSFLWQNGKSVYQLVWPEIDLGWRLVLGSVVGFLGAALGSVGGVGGGGVFVPMLTLIIGFNPKSSAAISMCMITGAAGSTVYCNLRRRHPTLNLPIVDYDLALLLQPMLMLGISIGVALNVIFADWMVTVLLTILFIGTSIKALFKGVETWKKENLIKKIIKLMESEYKEGGELPMILPSQTKDVSGPDYKLLPSGPPVHNEEVPIMRNIYWKEVALLVFVWVAFLAVQGVKIYALTCSKTYWVLNFLQVPVAVSVSLYEAICLYIGNRVIASQGIDMKTWKPSQLFLCGCCGILAGVTGGLLGLGGGFILGPLFLELGIPPQVASATSTFAMLFSSSMSVVQYLLLRRFPVTYGVYFLLVAMIGAVVAQNVVRRLILALGRVSLIIFILSVTIFVSAVSLGGVVIVNMTEKMENKEYMGFGSLCY